MQEDSLQFAQSIFDKALFIRHLGLQLEKVERGYVKTKLVVEERHKQQHGFVHVGVLTTLADHSAGVAGASILLADQDVLTIEFKVNFLRPAVSEVLICESRVLKPGKQIFVVESEIYGFDTPKSLCAKATVTLCVVNRQELRQNSPCKDEKE